MSKFRKNFSLKVVTTFLTNFRKMSAILTNFQVLILGLADSSLALGAFDEVSVAKFLGSRSRMLVVIISTR